MMEREKAARATGTAFKRNSAQAQYSTSSRYRQGRFDRSRLPDPSAYYQCAFLDLRPRGNRAMVSCCFHEDKTPSLALNLESGAFRCFGCGTHGGNVLDFQMKHHGQTFHDAVEALGAWDSNQQPNRKQDTGPTTGQLVKAFRQWENGEYWRLAAVYRAIRKVLDSIKDEADIERLGDLYHHIGPLEQRLDILSGRDERAKLELFRREVPHA